MAFILVGLNHRTAPVAMRERLSLSGCGLMMALEDICQRIQPGQTDNGTERLHEAVILSTCNRLEIYAVAPDAARGQDLIARFLSQLQGVPLADLRPHLYHMADEAVIGHLMRVAAGLDSMILGEPQVLGQVADAFADAQKTGTTGPYLSHLFAQALHAGKRARSETPISRHTTSVSHAAAILAEQVIGDLEGKAVLVVGAGEMAEQAVEALKMRGVQDILCINRTYARAEALAQEIGGEAYNWVQLTETLTRADIVISATGAPHVIIHADAVQEVIAARDGRPLLFVDIAVPRDIDEAVGDLPGVLLRDIDALQEACDENMAQRKTAIPQVEVILFEECERFREWLSGRDVVPVIKDLRRRAQSIAQAEIDQALCKLNGTADDHTEAIVNRLAHRIVNKLLHEPTLMLKAQAAAGDGTYYAHAIRELFALDADGQPLVNN